MEANFENSIIDLFQNNLGYDYLYGPNIERDFYNPLYEEVLLDSLHRLNNGAPDDAIQDALFKIKNFENASKWLKDEVKAESQKAIEVQKADNPTIKEVQKATEDLKNAIEKAKKAEENRQKEASLKIDEAQNILAENKSKPDELPVIDIEKIEELISKVKDKAKSKELTKKLQDIKDKIKAKEAKIELDKLEAARKKRDAEIAKQRLNSPETGFLREQNQENKATVPVLIGLVSLIISPVVVLFAKRRNRKMRKF